MITIASKILFILGLSCFLYGAGILKGKDICLKETLKLMSKKKSNDFKENMARIETLEEVCNVIIGNNGKEKDYD